MIDVASIWYRKSLHPLAFLLLPFSWLFGLIAAIRRSLYRAGIFKTIHFNVPVIVVGNITVGGTGKTPFVIWLAAFLRAQGYKPGIVSRGMGGKKHLQPWRVQASDAGSVVGDEALLLLQSTGCPLVIGVDRAAAVEKLLQESDCNIVISDDGLQHYRLSRQVEIVMVDGVRKLGNQQLLPAGPLRESPSRLQSADFVVIQGESDAHEHSMQLLPIEFVSVINPEHKIPFADFARGKVHAVAAIGHPQRFFAMLEKAGFELMAHDFPDHYLYQPADLNFADVLPILMTEKDVVKCAGFADQRYWTVKVNACVNESFGKALLEKLQ